MEEVKGSGRPRIETVLQKSRMVSTRLTAEEFFIVALKAKMVGVRISRYMREMLLKEKVMQRITPEDAKAPRLLTNEANAEGYREMRKVNACLVLKLNDIVKQLSDDWKDNKGR